MGIAAGEEVPRYLGARIMDGQQGAGMSKKERGNEAVRQFRKRQKVKEEADKEKTDRLRKENLELESRVASYQQELDFMVEVVRAHADLDGIREKRGERREEREERREKGEE